MIEFAKRGLVPAYILLCIVFGGSTQGVFFNMSLQLLGIVIITWSLMVRGASPLTGPARGLILLVCLVALIFLLQLIPLPPSLWWALPGREFVADGYRLLALPMPWLPLSLTPYETVATALTLIPPIAVLSAMLLLDAYRPSWIAGAVLLGTFAGVLLGVLQVGSADPLLSPWYLYRQSSFGSATGFFANSNHMAALLIISVPVLFATLRDLREGATNRSAQSAMYILATAGVLVIGVGIVLNGSLAVLLLGLPVAAISSTMLVSDLTRIRVSLALGALISVLGILVVYLTPLQDRLLQANSQSFESRQRIWSTTIRAVVDHLPVGSGVGSFRDVYPRYEDASAVTTTVVNHAHNDYLEVALETGVPGTLLLLFFLVWWSRRAGSIWRRTEDVYKQAAAITCGMLLLHSIVDYPLRVVALSTIMAASFAMLVQSRHTQSGAAEDLWPTRHAIA